MRQKTPKFETNKKAKKFPLMVAIYTTYVCNSKCPTCPFSDLNSNIRRTYQDAPFMPPDLFKKIADECGKFNAYMRLSGGGEPLLHKDILELIEYGKKVGAKIGLITNGSLISKEKADRLLAGGTDMVEFSVDAADAQTYSQIRVGLDFDTLVRNVKYMVWRRNEIASPTKIIVSVVHQQKIQDKIDSIINFWEKIADKVQVRKYLTWGINDPENSGDKSPYIENKKIPCPFPFERLNIDTRGQVMFCGYDIRGETNFGNVNYQTIQSIWQGERFNAWRQLHLRGRGDKVPICRKCPDWQYRSWTYNYWKIEREAEKRRSEVIGDE